MATESSGQSASDKQTSGVKTGSGGFARRLPKTPHPRISQKTLLYTLLAIVILAGVVVVLHNRFHLGEKVYAQAAGHKIYKADVEKLIGNAKGISNHEAATVLADKYLTEA